MWLCNIITIQQTLKIKFMIPQSFLTCTIRMLNPVSRAKFSRTFRHGFGDSSKDALNARLCCVVKIVRGRFGPRLPSIRL